MLTESCVMCFSPSRAVLSAILRDEYLTSAVRTSSLVLWAIYQIPKISPEAAEAYIFQRLSLRGLFLEGLIYGGKFGFNIDWATLINGRKFTVFALFYFVFEGNFRVQAGLIFGGAI